MVFVQNLLLRVVHLCFRLLAQMISYEKLEPWASKPTRHYFEGLNMQRSE